MNSRFKQKLAGFICLFASVPVLAGPYETGIEAFRMKDYPAAIQSWSSPELAEDARALFGLGVMYVRGMGTDQDIGTGVDYYQQSARLGSASAQYNLGLAYFMQRGVAYDPDQAKIWWQKAALQDHATAQYNLGALLWSGRGVQQDQAAAMMWFRRAMANGSRDAVDFLSALYEPMAEQIDSLGGVDEQVGKGRKIPLIEEIGMFRLGQQAMEGGSPEQAFGYWLPLAEDGHPESQFLVATLYESGEGVTADFPVSLDWYQKAADNGQADAQYRIGLFHMTESDDPNPSLGLYWMQSAADRKQSQAIKYLDENR